MRIRLSALVAVFLLACLAFAPSASAAVPTAVASYSPAQPWVNSPVSFDGRFSICEDTPCTYEWKNIGGAVFGTAQTASFTYQFTGQKDVDFKVTDAQGDFDIKRLTFTVAASPPPTPQFTADTEPATSVDHDSAVLNAKATCSNNASGVYWYELRDMSNGAGPWGASDTQAFPPNPSCSSSFSGALGTQPWTLNPSTPYEFRVCWSLIDETSKCADRTAEGGTNYESFTSSPTPAPDAQPVADYTYSFSGTGMTVNFDSAGDSDASGAGTVCADAPCTYSWFNVGGSTFGTGPTASFTYSVAGTKTTRLTVTDADGDTSVKERSFSVPGAVDPPPPAPKKCADGIDNDGDGKIDLADPGCVDAADDDETDPVTPPPSGLGKRNIPIGLYNTNDQTLSAAGYRYAVRFSVDKDTVLDRFVIGTRDKGASWSVEGGGCSGTGAGCYGAGNGGTLAVQITTRKADGTPDLGNVLASETIGAQAAWNRTKTAYSSPTPMLSMHFEPRNAGARATLLAGVPYAMVIRNTHASPGSNFVSVESIDVKKSEAGPQDRNETDPNACCAIAGFEPREGASWSTNSGSTWTHGQQVGPYFGSTTSDDGTRLPWYGIQALGESNPTHGQPYNAYKGSCLNCTLRLKNAPRARTLTQAGGYATVGNSVGVVTVTNVRTGQSSSTPSLGTGIRTGTLATPIAIAVGDEYTIRASGRVSKAENDAFQARIYKTGSATGPWPFTTDGQGTDRAEVFALPHPWHPG